MAKKILFLISSMTNNGAERVMSLLVNKSVADGHTVELALQSNNIVEYDLNPTAKVKFVGSSKKGLFAIFDRLHLLKKEIRTFKPDVIVSFLTTCNIYACLANVGQKSKLIISERNDPINDCPSKLRRIIRNLSYRLADGVIFQTDFAKQCFSKRIQDKSVVIPNPVKNDLPISNRNNTEKVIVAAGRLTKQKNYPLMIKAFSKFYQTHNDYRLDIYGKGELKDELVALVEELNLSNAVFFKGAVSDLHERIKSAKMFVLSSDYEGISNSLLEAMSMGLPCISTDCPCGGSRHLITNKENGLLVPVNDIDAFAEAMNDIVEHNLCDKMYSENALTTRETHNEKIILSDYFNFIFKD